MHIIVATFVIENPETPFSYLELESRHIVFDGNEGEARAYADRLQAGAAEGWHFNVHKAVTAADNLSWDAVPYEYQDEDYDL